MAVQKGVNGVCLPGVEVECGHEGEYGRPRSLAGIELYISKIARGYVFESDPRSRNQTRLCRGKYEATGVALGCLHKNILADI